MLQGWEATQAAFLWGWYQMLHYMIPQQRLVFFKNCSYYSFFHQDYDPSQLPLHEPFSFWTVFYIFCWTHFSEERLRKKTLSEVLVGHNSAFHLLWITVVRLKLFFTALVNITDAPNWCSQQHIFHVNGHLSAEWGDLQLPQNNMFQF